MVSKGNGLVLAGLLIVTLVLVAPVGAAEITIDSPGALIPTTIINDTINAGTTLDGDTIILNPGTYLENGITITGKSLTLRAAAGHGPSDTIIDGKTASPRILTITDTSSLTIDNLTLRNGRGTNGGAIYNTGGSITVTSSTISGCSAIYGSGGAIYNNGGSVTITSSKFTWCSATYNSGAIFNYISGSVTVTSSTISGCSVDSGSGGAIFNYGMLNITSSTITGCSATYGSGGAIFNYGMLNITTSTISSCSAGSGSGGAIYNDISGTVTVTSSTISGCSALYGGAIYNYGTLVGTGSVTVTSSTISGCSATSGSGGAIYNFNGGTVTVTSSTISGCSATYGSGGAIFNYGMLNITSSTISGCSAGSGGAIYNDISGIVTVQSSSTISDCSATSYGGAIYNTGGTVTVTTTTISGCSAGLGGGAMYNFSGGTVTIHFSRIYHCNTGTAVVLGDGTINAENNWWGSNAEPSGSVSGAVTYTPWLLLGITASPSSITTAQTSAIRINLTNSSAGTDTSSGGIFVPDGIPVAFGITSGTGSILPLAGNISTGANTTTFSPLYGSTTGISGTVDDQIVYLTLLVSQGAPTVNHITPATWLNTTTISITNLSGTNFITTGTTTVNLTRTGYANITATGVTIVDSTNITCSLPITHQPAGTWNVVVINPDGQEGILPDGFAITAPAPVPTVTGITPATGQNTSTISITNLAGTNFVTGNTVRLNGTGFSDIAGTSVIVVSDTLITTQFDLTDKLAGQYNVVVTNTTTGLEGMLATGFTVTNITPAVPPTVTGITPNTGINSSSISITNLAGTNFAAGATVSLTRTGYTNITAASVNVPLTTQITCTFPIIGAEAGAWDVVVINPDGQEGAMPGAFTVTALVPTLIPTPTQPPVTLDTRDLDNDRPYVNTPVPTSVPLSGQLMTVTVNIGGDSKAWQAIVTGMKLSDLIVTGTVQSGAGGNFTAPPGTVFQYISLIPARYNTITKAMIHFTVPQAWLDENHIAPGSIVLYHQTANGWEVLPTTVLSTKDGTVYFSAQSTGFSLFAIAGTPGSSAAVSAPMATIGSFADRQEPVRTAVVTKAPVKTSTTAAPPVPTTPAPGFPFMTAALIGAGCIVLIGSGWYVRRWWIRRQNPALFREYD